MAHDADCIPLAVGVAECGSDRKQNNLKKHSSHVKLHALCVINVAALQRSFSYTQWSTSTLDISHTFSEPHSLIKVHLPIFLWRKLDVIVVVLQANRWFDHAYCKGTIKLCQVTCVNT